MAPPRAERAVPSPARAGPSPLRAAGSALARVPHLVAVPCLLAGFVLCGWMSLRGDSATSDETAHVPAGYTYLDRGDFRLNPEHPPLAKAWAALPVWLRERGRAEYGSREWLGRDAIAPGAPGAPGADAGARTNADQWLFGFSFLNGPPDDPVRLDPDPVLHASRLMVLVLGLGLLLAVYGWARELWGRGGALLATALAALSPSVLAHARLVTTDLAAALGFVLSLWTFARLLRAFSPVRLVVAGLALGVALLSKFTALLLLPVLVVAATVAAAWPSREAPAQDRRLPRSAAALAGVLLVAWGVLWAGYGFRYRASPDPAYVLPWELMERQKGPPPLLVEAAVGGHLVPEAYLFGFTSAMHDEIRLAFLNGVESIVGWRSYFPIAFAIKTPPSFLLLALWALASWWGQLPRGQLPKGQLSPKELSPKVEVVLLLLVPLVLYAAMSVRSRLNIGHRHLLPLEPLLCVLAGSLAARARASRTAAAVLALCLGGSAVSFASATPGYLSYFNVFGGGTRGGWRHLLDSNVDWGQDLARLKRWQTETRSGPVALAYFGSADPRAYGLAFRKVVIVHDFRPEQPAVVPQPGDLLAVSVNLLQGLYLYRDRELARAVHARGWMDNTAIRPYTEMLHARVRDRELYPTFGDWAIAEGLLSREQVREASEDLLATRFARLRDTQTPVARIGGSILVYRITTPWGAAASSATRSRRSRAGPGTAAASPARARSGPSSRRARRGRPDAAAPCAPGSASP